MLEVFGEWVIHYLLKIRSIREDISSGFEYEIL